MFFTNYFIDPTLLGFPWQSKRLFISDNDILSKIETKLAAAVLSLCLLTVNSLVIKVHKVTGKGWSIWSKKNIFFCAASWNNYHRVICSSYSYICVLFTYLVKIQRKHASVGLRLQQTDQFKSIISGSKVWGF